MQKIALFREFPSLHCSGHCTVLHSKYMIMTSHIYIMCLCFTKYYTIELGIYNCKGRSRKVHWRQWNGIIYFRTTLQLLFLMWIDRLLVHLIGTTNIFSAQTIRRGSLPSILFSPIWSRFLRDSPRKSMPYRIWPRTFLFFRKLMHTDLTWKKR